MAVARGGSSVVGSRQHLEDVLGALAGVAERHAGVVAEEQRVLRSGVAAVQGPLEHDHPIGLPDAHQGLPAIGLTGSSATEGLTVSLAPVTRTTEVMARSSLTSSTSSTMP
jgi:hypothetical protein